jgi:osmotically-inducible protein OsmY
MIATSSSSEIACSPWVSEIGHDRPLRETVYQRLRCSGYSSLSNIKIEVADGVVAVFGVVPSFFLKQMAQTIILKTGQAKAIKNNLQVPHSYFDPSL